MRASWIGAVRCRRCSPIRSASFASAVTAREIPSSCWLTCCGSVRPWLPARLSAAGQPRRNRPGRAPPGAGDQRGIHRLHPGRPGHTARRGLPYVFGLDRCCEGLTAVTDLARELGVPAQLTGVVEQTYQRALQRFGPVDGELMAVARWRRKPGSGSGTDAGRERAQIGAAAWPGRRAGAAVRGGVRPSSADSQRQIGQLRPFATRALTSRSHPTAGRQTRNCGQARMMRAIRGKAVRCRYPSSQPWHPWHGPSRPPAGRSAKAETGAVDVRVQSVAGLI